jgi:hypothetical protein
MRNRKRDSDDRDSGQWGRDEVPQRQPPARKDDPDHVPENGPGGGCSNRLSAEWPKSVSRETEGSDTPGDGDDQNDHDDPGYGIPECELDTTEKQPDDVADDFQHVLDPLICPGLETGSDLGVYPRPSDER